MKRLIALFIFLLLACTKVVYIKEPAKRPDPEFLITLDTAATRNFTQDIDTITVITFEVESWKDTIPIYKLDTILFMREK